MESNIKKTGEDIVEMLRREYNEMIHKVYTLNDDLLKITLTTSIAFIGFSAIFLSKPKSVYVVIGLISFSLVIILTILQKLFWRNIMILKFSQLDNILSIEGYPDKNSEYVSKKYAEYEKNKTNAENASSIYYIVESIYVGLFVIGIIFVVLSAII